MIVINGSLETIISSDPTASGGFFTRLQSQETLVSAIVNSSSPPESALTMTELQLQLQSESGSEPELSESSMGRRVKKLEELNIHKDDAASVTFTWKIDNFSKLNAVKHYSDVYVIGCFEWRILMYPRGKKTVGYLSVYLDVTGSSTLPKGWARYAQFSLSVVNQLQSSKSITKGNIQMAISPGPEDN
ncbi:hypothetical protein C1H46_040158 [Malus baccata]|uniref:MATH domain-containing protein n=1 Tax=Malus baccata TaxID=106549 RepID=A0A540KJE7_MALBA|nr:hypothetical protein C1H46_040158 [Malus baccata]